MHMLLIVVALGVIFVRLSDDLVIVLTVDQSGESNRAVLLYKSYKKDDENFLHPVWCVLPGQREQC